MLKLGGCLENHCMSDKPKVENTIHKAITIKANTIWKMKKIKTNQSSGIVSWANQFY